LSYESDRKLSLEELKQRNKAQPSAEPMSSHCPMTQEKLDNLFYNQSLIWNGVVDLQEQIETLHKRANSVLSQINSLPTRSELEQISKSLSQIQQMLSQAGKKKEKVFFSAETQTADFGMDTAVDSDTLDLADIGSSVVELRQVFGTTCYPCSCKELHYQSGSSRTQKGYGSKGR